MQSENHNINPNFLALFQATHSIPSSGSSYSFIDTRLKLDLQKDSNYHELNLGLARRQAFNNQHNRYYGVYGFWDISHTKNQVYLTQTTLGTEVISPHWYWNINGYLPLETYTTAYSFLDNINTSTTVFNKNLFLREQQGYLLTTKALRGFDSNLARTWNINTETQLNTTLHYQFFTDNNNIFLQGPGTNIGLVKKRKSHSESVQLSYQYNHYHGHTVGLHTEMQWQKPLASRRLHNNDIILTPIKRDINVLFSEANTPNHKPYLFVSMTGFWRTDTDIDLYFFLEKVHKDYEVVVTENSMISDILFSGSISTHSAEETQTLKDHPAKIKIHYTAEVNQDWSVDLRDLVDTYDLVMGFDYLEHTNYIRLPYHTFFHRENYSTEYIRKQQTCEPNKKYFSCFLVRNRGEAPVNQQGYLDRKTLFNQLSQYKFVASGGSLYHNIDGPGPRQRRLNSKTIKEWRDDNLAWISQCKFMIAYENQYYPGYMTEKPYQAWAAGAVPIYTADPEVVAHNEINTKAIINSFDFPNTESLVDHIIKIDQDDDAYCNIWNQHLLTNPEVNYDHIKSQLESRIQQLIDQKLPDISTTAYRYRLP